MARFYPLYVRRSDGKTEITVKGKRKELNQPTESQLDQQPDKDGVSDFYREVGLDEPKHLDWRRKLGGMLAREMEWRDKPGNDGGYILVSFPENYRLYEHVKRTEKDGKTEFKNKTHAAGGNDRQDAYLYGHPVGRKKRFRSPGDFFPHLLWLCTDESGDPDNCSCKLCCPEDGDPMLSGGRAKSEKSVIKDVDTSATASAQVQVQRRADAQDVNGRSNAMPTAPATTASRSGTRSSYSPGSSNLQPGRPPQLPWRSEDQRIDAQYNFFLYRPGELVWFMRGGPAWGLGVISRRWVTSSPPQHLYTVQPLSNPFHHLPPEVKSRSDEMRPWLAWSVPRFTHEVLNEPHNMPSYETADWSGLLSRKYGAGEVDVDASIMAAKFVDTSYTLFGKGETSEREPGVLETSYDGVFLGAEKIWVGEPVRLENGREGARILVIKSLGERIVKGQVAGPGSVQIIGDIYHLALISHYDPNIPTPAAASNNPFLPTRLTEDLAWRNARSIVHRQLASFWKLSRPMAQCALSEIKGRWYEASILMPILMPEKISEEFEKGDISETSRYLNSRLDCLNANRPPQLPRIPMENTRRGTRLEALGGAVPPTTEIRDGIEPPAFPATSGTTAQSLNNTNGDTMTLDPATFPAGHQAAAPTTAPSTSANDALRPHHQHEPSTYTSSDLLLTNSDANSNTTGTLDEFMDLGGMDDDPHLAGFNANFPTQPDGHQGYY